MEHFKLSTSRDFRIHGATLEAALHETIVDEEEDQDKHAEVFNVLSYYVKTQFHCFDLICFRFISRFIYFVPLKRKIK